MPKQSMLTNSSGTETHCWSEVKKSIIGQKYLFESERNSAIEVRTHYDVGESINTRIFVVY